MDPVIQTLIDDTWKELGYKIRPLKRKIVVRTLPQDFQRIGSLWKPAKYASFHGELPHQVTTEAYVLYCGPSTTVKPGEKVCFTRLYFAWHKKMADGTYVGWVDESQLSGYSV